MWYKYTTSLDQTVIQLNKNYILRDDNKKGNTLNKIGGKKSKKSTALVELLYKIQHTEKKVFAKIQVMIRCDADLTHTSHHTIYSTIYTWKYIHFSKTCIRLK